MLKAMRLRLGRPDLDDYAGRFAVPRAVDDSALTATFLGVATILVSDGSSAILTDGFFSRPALSKVALGKIAPHVDRIDACLSRAGIDHLDAVLPVHSHYDHALDSAVVADRTRATLVGGDSTANIGRGHGLPEKQILVARSGDTNALGAFDITTIASHHCPPDRFPGTIDHPLTPPARASAYRCGEAWSLLVHHRPTGRRMLIQGSAGWVDGALDGHRAEVAYLGVGQLGIHDESYLRTYWEQSVRMVGAQRVILIHWDDFFRPLDQPLRASAYAVDDLDKVMRILGALAEKDRVELLLPTTWRREDPWHDLRA